MGGATHFHFKIIALLVQMLCSGRLESIRVHLAAMGRVEGPLRGGATVAGWGGIRCGGAPEAPQWGCRGGQEEQRSTGSKD